MGWEEDRKEFERRLRAEASDAPQNVPRTYADVGVNTAPAPEKTAKPKADPALDVYVSPYAIAEAGGDANKAREAAIAKRRAFLQLTSGQTLGGPAMDAPPPPPAAAAPSMPEPKRPGSLVAQAAAAPNYRSGAGGGGSSISKLKADYDAAVQGQFPLYSKEQDYNADLAQQEVEKQSTLARLEEQHAMERREDALIQQRHDAAAAAKHEAFLARSEQLSDQLGEMKIDPSRLMRNQDAGHKFLFMLGGMLGGLAAGPQGTNQYLARVDKEIEHDIKAQIAEHENKKAQITARQSIFSQMMAETGDQRLAAQQTRLLMLEASKQHIDAQARRLGIPSVLTRSAAINNLIDQTKIQPLKIDIAKNSYATAVAQANAAAAAEQARVRERRERFYNTAKELVTAGASEQEAMEGAARMDALLYSGKAPDYAHGQGFAGKEAEKRGVKAEKDAARFVATGQDANGKPTGYMAPTEDEGKGQRERIVARQKMVGLIDRAVAVRKEAGTLGRVLWREGSLKLFTPEWQNKLRTIKSQMELEFTKTVGGVNRLNEKELELAHAALGDIESAGSSPEERLEELKRSIQAADTAERDEAAGQHATKLSDKSTVLGAGINAPPAEKPPGQPIGGVGAALGIPSDGRAKRFMEKMGGDRQPAGLFAVDSPQPPTADRTTRFLQKMRADGPPSRSDARLGLFVERMRGGGDPMYSDDRVKLTAARQDAYEHGLSVATHLATLPPERLREEEQRGHHYSPVAGAILRAKANEGGIRAPRSAEFVDPTTARQLEVNRGGVTHDVTSEGGQLWDEGVSRDRVPSYATAARKDPDLARRRQAIEAADARMRGVPVQIGPDAGVPGPRPPAAPATNERLYPPNPLSEDYVPPLPQNGMSGPIAMNGPGIPSDPRGKRGIMSAKYALFLERMRG